MELLDIFKRHLASTKSTSSRSTVKNYLSDVRHFIGWYENLTKSPFDIRQVTADVIRLYEKTLGGTITNGILASNTQLSVISMKRHLSSLRKFFTVLEKENLKISNPFTQILPEVSEVPTDYWHFKSFKDHLQLFKASPITIKNYLSDVQNFARWYEEAILPELDKPLTATGGFYLITQSILEDYRKRLIQVQNAAPRTINRKLSSLRRYLDFANKKGFISNTELTLDPIKIYEESVTNPKEEGLSIVELSAPTTELSYSKFPPFRLMQKLFVFPYLSLEEKSANIIAGIIAGKPVSGAYNLPKRLAQQLKEKNILRTQNQSLDSMLGIRNIQKEFYAPDKVSLLGIPLHKKAIFHARFTRPNWYKKYHNYAFVHYVHFALLIIFASGVGVALYNNLVLEKQRQASAAPTAPPRILSFQGRLTDNSDTPITTTSALRFAIYSDPSASGGALLWQEAITDIEPDDDGIFSIYLGGGTSIPSTVFTDNASIYLGVTVEKTPELTPRQRIATVGYATNAEFLQGLPPTTQAGITSFSNVVLALDSSGNLTLSDSAPTNHTFQVNNGMFKLSGQTLQLTTNSGSDGTISLIPNGFGQIDLQKAIINDTNNGSISPGGVEIRDKFAILATESAVAAFMINNDTTGGDIFSASSSGITRFTIANDGTLTDSFYNAQNGVLYGTQFTGVLAQATTASPGLCLQSGASNPTWGVCSSGINSSPFQVLSGAIVPMNSTNDLLVGGQATTAAKFRFVNVNTGTPVASISANLSDGALFLAGDGNIGTTNRQTLTLGNSSTYNTTGNILINPNGFGKIGIGTTTPLAPFDLRGNSGIQPAASISANTSYATLVVDNAGSGDLFAASASGVPNFVIRNNGDIVVGYDGEGKISAAVIDPYLIQNQKTTGITSLSYQTMGGAGADHIFVNTSTELSRLTTAGQLRIPITGSSAGLVVGGDAQLFRGAADRLDLASGDSFNVVSGSLLTGGTTRIDSSGNGTFTNLNVTGSCTGCIATNDSPFQMANGAIFPYNSTVDFLIGAQSTASAKFAVLGINGDNPTASVSATSGSNSGNGITLGSDGSIQSLNRNTLSIGGSTTGNVKINAGSSTRGLKLFSNDKASFGFLDSFAAPSYGLEVAGGIMNYGYNLFGNTVFDDTAPVIGVGSTSFGLSSSTHLYLWGGSGGFVFKQSGGTEFARIDATGKLGLGTASGISQLHITRPLSFGVTGKALAIFDQIENQDILTASAAGTTRFTIANNGNLTASTYSSCTLKTDSSGLFTCGTDNTGGSGSSNWVLTSANGTLNPINNTLDILVGGTSTASAKFAVLNIAGGTPTASISANSGDNATYINGLGNIGTTNRQTLTIGNSSTNNTTGQVLINPNGTGNVGIGTTNPSSTLHVSSTGNNQLLISDSDSASDQKHFYFRNSNGILDIGALDDAYSVYSSILSIRNDPSQFVGISDFAPDAVFEISGSNGGNDLFFVSSDDNSDGDVLTLDSNKKLGLGTASPLSALHITRPLSFSATGKSLAIFDQIENQDILTASAGGTTRFTIANNGTITASAYTTNGGLFYANGSGVFAQTAAGTGSQCLLGGTTPTWGSCAAGGTDSPFQVVSNAIVPLNSTLDFLLGGQSTASAKFAVLNMAGGTPTATVSGNIIIYPNNGAGGRIGINNSNPSALIDVRSVSNSVPLFQARPTTDGLDTPYFKITSNMNGGNSQVLIDSTDDTNTGRLRLDPYNQTGLYQINSQGTDSLEMYGNIVDFKVGGSQLLYAQKDGLTFGSTIALSNGRFHFTGTRKGNALAVYNETGTVNDILTASASGTTRLVITNRGGLGLNAGANNTTLLSTLDVRANPTNGGTIAVASVSGRTSFATLMADNFGVGDIFTASSSSNTQFVVRSNGQVGIGNAARIPTAQLDVAGNASISSALTFRAGAGSIQTSGNSHLTLGGTNTGDISITPRNGSGILNLNLASTNGIKINGTFATGLTGGNSCVTDIVNGLVTGTSACAGSSSGSNWTLSTANGTIRPNNSTLDLLIGGATTASAKFAVLGLADGANPTASVSATTGVNTGNGITIAGDGSIQSLRNNTLTIGGNTTGNISLLPLGGTLGKVGIGANSLSNYTLSSTKLELTDADGSNSDLAFRVAGGGWASTYYQKSTGTLSSPTVVSDGDNLGETYFMGFDGTDFVAAAKITAGINGTPASGIMPGYLALNTTGIDGNNYDRLTVTSAGNVGIGETVPISQLYVTRPLDYGANGKALAIFDQIENQDIFTASAGGTTKFTVKNTGRLDINFGGSTGDPFAWLTGNGGSIYMANAGETISTKWFLAPGADNFLTGVLTGDSGITLKDGTGGFVLGRTNGTVQFKMTNEGKFGMGTYDSPTGVEPRAKLQVYGTSSHQPTASISAKQTSAPSLLVTQDGSGDLIVASYAGLTKFQIANNGDIHFWGSLVPEGSDLAEYFKKENVNEQFEAGQLVCLAPNGATKCTSTNSSHRLIGVVSDNAFLTGGGDRKNDPRYVLAGMVGQLGVKVTGMVMKGDPLTLSSTPGYATAARSEGEIIGYAMEDNINGESRIATVIQPKHYNPHTNLQTELALNSLSFTLNSGIYMLTDTANNNIEHIDAFSKLAVAELKAGSINAQRIIAGSINATSGYIGSLTGNTLSFAQGAFSSLTASIANIGSLTTSTLAVATDSITIGGQNIRDFIIATVQNAGLIGGPVSPLAEVNEIKTNVVSPLTDGADISLQFEKNELSIKNSNKKVAWFDNNGNATFSGELAAQSASISGTLAANNIQTTDASVGGTLRTNNLIADNIDLSNDALAKLEGNFGIDQKLATLAAAINNQQPASSSQQPATSSGQTLNSNLLAVDMITANFGIFEQGITSMGPVTANIVTATDQLAVGSSFTITNNAINTIGADLEIQSFRQGAIAFQGGLIKMDTDGNMEIAGNLNVLGEIDAVFGVFSGSLTSKALATSLISPLPGDDLTIKLSDDASSNSAKLRVTNGDNKEVLSINNKGDIISSGAATLSKLNFNLVGQAIATSLSEATATGSAGFATLRSGQPELTIKNPNITSKSLIYITPFGDTNNKVLYLLRQVPHTTTEDGSFTIGVSGTTTQNIQFNWLIVN